MQMRGNAKTPTAAPGIASKKAGSVRAAQVSAFVRRILVELGFSLSELNSLCAAWCHANSASRLPHALCSTWKKGVSPHVIQVAALSNLTNFLLIDWLALF